VLVVRTENNFFFFLFFSQQVADGGAASAISVVETRIQQSLRHVSHRQATRTTRTTKRARTTRRTRTRKPHRQPHSGPRRRNVVETINTHGVILCLCAVIGVVCYVVYVLPQLFFFVFAQELTHTHAHYTPRQTQHPHTLHTTHPHTHTPTTHTHTTTTHTHYHNTHTTHKTHTPRTHAKCAIHINIKPKK